MKDRIRKVIDAAGGRMAFSRSIGVSYTVVSGWYNGRMCTNLLRAVHKTFPWVSLNWLMYGEGEMYLPKKKGELQYESLVAIKEKAEILIKEVDSKLVELKKLEIDD